VLGKGGRKMGEDYPSMTQINLQHRGHSCLLQVPTPSKQDYDSYVLTPKGDLIKFTPDTSGPAGWGEPRVIDHNIAPDPNPQQ